MAHLLVSTLQHLQFLMDSFHIWLSWSLTWGVCHAQWPLSLTYISRSFSYDFLIKLLEYGTSCRVCSTASTVLDGFFPYLALMITSMRGCFACNGLRPWPISSRLFSCDIAYFMDYSYASQIQPMRGWCVMYYFQVNRSKVNVTQVVWIFAVRAEGISDLSYV